MRVSEWPLTWEIVAYTGSANDMFFKYKYLIVNLVVSLHVLWGGNFFLMASFPDHCLLCLFDRKI